MEFYKNCPICSSKKIKIKHSKISSQNTLDSFDIFECENCQLQFVGQILTEKYIENYYSHIKKMDHVYTDENKNNLNYYYLALKKKIEEALPQKGKILDIGCSSGYFLDVMHGWEKYGVEISNKYASVASKKYGDNIFHGSIDDYESEDEFFDVITLQDSLDHMLSPEKILNKCNKLLKPDGYIIIKVHNMDSLYAKISGKNFYAFIPPEHLFYFNKKSMIHLLKSTGFETVSFKFIPHLFQIKTVFLRISRNISNKLSYKIYQKIKNTWLGNISFKKDLHDIFTVFAKKSGEKYVK